MNDYCVIGYNTKDLGLPLFKVFDTELPTGHKLSAKEVQDAIASDQAMRSPHIIYTVVKKSDLWW